MDTTIFISALTLSFAILFALRQYNRSKERRAMIEKGLDPSLIDIYSSKLGARTFLFAGIILLGVAIGIIAGITLAAVFKTPGETKEFILLSTIVCTGLSCFACYYLSRDKTK